MIAFDTIQAVYNKDFTTVECLVPNGVKEF